MSSKRYTPVFRAEVIRQATEREYPVNEIERRPGVSIYIMHTIEQNHR